MLRTVNERIIFGMLEKLSFGTLILTDAKGDQRRFGDQSNYSDLQADIQILDARVYADILRGGDIAFAECFMDERVTTNDLPALLKLFAKNRQIIEQAIHGNWWGVLFDRLLHLFRRNSKAQAKKNIEAHYDLGNDFYKLWLDPSMTYSSALFTADANCLNSAQQAKYERVLAQLIPPSSDSSASQKILEIGCGWGGFAEVAAKAGREVTGLTLSTEQLKYAKERLDKLGVSGQADLKLQDYRDEGVTTPHQYDAIASIEMFEAVGEAYWPSYFECVARNLKNGGRACIQSIVIRHDLFARYRKGTDFIQRYIFPGGMLPSPEVFSRTASKHGLRVVDEFSFGQDYARTLAAWRRYFLEKLTQIRTLGYSEKFIRMWHFYLAYCEAGFEMGDTDVMHFTLEKI